MTRKALTVGPHGGENLGDELILSMVLDALRSGDFEPTAMSSHPLATEADHAVTAIRQVNVKARRFSTLRDIDQYDLVVIAGGEQLAEGRYHNPLWGHLANAWIVMSQAHRKGVPYGLYSVGCEEIRSRIGRSMLRSILTRSSFAAIRDRGSFEYLSRLAPEAHLVLTADPVLLLPRQDHSSSRASLRERFDLPDVPLILFAPADDHRINTNYIDHAVRGLTEAAERIGGLVLVQAMEHQPDYDPRLLSRPVFTHDRIRVLPLERFNRGQLVALFAGVDQVTSARMHPLIVAATQGTPWLALNRNRKLENFALEIGGESVGLGVSPRDLSSQVEKQVKSGREVWQAHADEGFTELRARAKVAAELLQAVVLP